MQSAPAQAAVEDGWVELEDPEEAFGAMVPGKTRIDNTRIGKPGAAELGACRPKEDRRTPVFRTRLTPFRWICKLQVVAREGNDRSYSEGSGILIGDRFVLTAAHVLMEAVRRRDGTVVQRDVSAVVVIPGLTAIRGQPGNQLPFGWTSGRRIRIHPGYRRVFLRGLRTPSAIDFGLVELEDPMGNRRFPSLNNRRLGWWGSRTDGDHTVIRPVGHKVLKKLRVNVAGYPGDKCRDQPRKGSIDDAALNVCTASDRGSMQWWSFDRVQDAGDSDVAFQKMELSHGLAPGTSGGAVWVRWQARRNLLGVVHACQPGADSSAVRLTNEVNRQLQTWMAEA